MVAKIWKKIPINIKCEKNEFKIECTKPLYLNEIKELIRQKVRNLNEFDLLCNSDIITEDDDIEAAYSKSNNFLVVRKNN